MKNLQITAVYTEINKVTNIEKTDNGNIYTEIFTKIVSIFYTDEKNGNIFIDTHKIHHTNYKQFTDKVEEIALKFLGKKATDFDTISPNFVLHSH